MQCLKTNDMKNLIKIEPIAVRNKQDVIDALDILETIGINVYTKEQKENYLKDDSKEVNNNFLIQDDEGFRIQSHYLGFGIPIDSLREQVKNIREVYPDILELQKEIKQKKENLQKEIKQLEDKQLELTENLTTLVDGQILIKEN